MRLRIYFFALLSTAIFVCASFGERRRAKIDPEILESVWGTWSGTDSGVSVSVSVEKEISVEEDSNAVVDFSITEAGKQISPLDYDLAFSASEMSIKVPSLNFSLSGKLGDLQCTARYSKGKDKGRMTIVRSVQAMRNISKIEGDVVIDGVYEQFKKIYSGDGMEDELWRAATYLAFANGVLPTADKSKMISSIAVIDPSQNAAAYERSVVSELEKLFSENNYILSRYSFRLDLAASSIGAGRMSLIRIGVGVSESTALTLRNLKRTKCQTAKDAVALINREKLPTSFKRDSVSEMVVAIAGFNPLTGEVLIMDFPNFIAWIHASELRKIALGQLYVPAPKSGRGN